MTTKTDLRGRDGKLVNSWYIACLSYELKVGRPLARTLYDTPYVFFRNNQGGVTCLPDRCMHRHAQLSKGVVINGELGCPYHGWMYGHDGKVVEVPSEGRRRESSDQKLCLKPRPTREQQGVVWVWLGDDVPTVEPYSFPHVGDEGWAHYIMITDFNNEATQLIENFMDVPHTVFVHKGWFRRQSKIKVPIRVDTENGRVLVTYEQPSDQIGFTSRLLNPHNEPMMHTDCYIFPNVTRVDYTFGSSRAFIINSQMTPVSTLKSRVYTAIIFKLGWLTKPMYPFLRFYTRWVIEQDTEIMENQAGNLRRDMTLRFNNSAADILHEEIEHLRALGVEGANPYAITRSHQADIWI